MFKFQFFNALLAGALASSALASGNSPYRPPRPPREVAPEADTRKMDDAHYALGKAVFTGKARRVSNPAATKRQKAQLTQLAGRLGREGTSLPSLAGQLSDEQMQALEYYVQKRFGAR